MYYCTTVYYVTMILSHSPCPTYPAKIMFQFSTNDTEVKTPMSLQEIQDYIATFINPDCYCKIQVPITYVQQTGTKVRIEGKIK